MNNMNLSLKFTIVTIVYRHDTEHGTLILTRDAMDSSSVR